jgi:hypothetical protein
MPEQSNNITRANVIAVVAALGIVAEVGREVEAHRYEEVRTSGHPVMDQIYGGEVPPSGEISPKPVSGSGGVAHAVNAGPVRWSFALPQPSVTTSRAAK